MLQSFPKQTNIFTTKTNFEKDIEDIIPKNFERNNEVNKNINKTKKSNKKMNNYEKKSKLMIKKKLIVKKLKNMIIVDIINVFSILIKKVVESKN